MSGHIKWWKKEKKDLYSHVVCVKGGWLNSWQQGRKSLMKALLGWSVSCNNVLLLPLYLALRHIVYTEHKERWALQRGVQPLAAGAYVCISSSATSLFLSQSASLGATLCYCHKLVVSPCAGEGLVPVSAERRVTSGERSELRLQETPTTCCFLAGTPNICTLERGGL